MKISVFGVRAVLLGLLLAGSSLGGAAASDVGARWITLGTHGGPLIGLRAQPANALVVNGTIYVVDAGNGIAGQLVKAGLKVTDVGVIFISHNHDDHNADMGTLAGLEYTAGRSEPINIYGPPGTERAMQGFAAFYGVNAEIRAEESNVSKPFTEIILTHDLVAPGVVYKDANVTVTAAENEHYHFAPGDAGYGKDRSYAYRFETARKVYVYTGDTGPSAAVTALAKDADVLVTEVFNVPAMLKFLAATAGDRQRPTPERLARILRHFTDEHLSPAEVGKMAAAAHVKEVLLTHIIPEVPDSALDATFVDGVKASYSGPVIVAKDLASY
jgi:ribonuclease BN (tRNA processing enzyme)